LSSATERWAPRRSFLLMSLVSHLSTGFSQEFAVAVK